ncbi:MAG TPA: FmdB family zinc ribbon protein [Candidatus Limnocylindria bacterium]
MPTYDYQCRSCGTVIEVIHPMTEEGPSTCEVCGGEMRRILHPAGIIFKGSGFYKTDSRSASSASVPAGTKAGATSGDGTSSTGSSGGGTSGGADKKPAGGSSSTSAAAD